MLNYYWCRCRTSSPCADGRWSSLRPPCAAALDQLATLDLRLRRLIDPGIDDSSRLMERIFIFICGVGVCVVCRVLISSMMVCVVTISSPGIGRTANKCDGPIVYVVRVFFNLLGFLSLFCLFASHFSYEKC